MILSKYFQQFIHNSKSSGIVLIVCVLVSLLIANSSLSLSFQNFLDSKFGFEAFHLDYSVSVWINDGLMAIFFLLVGLEIKRELLEGELSDIKKASLPIFAAVGGMLIPALIYFSFNHDTDYKNGWAIPMATDIAFSLAIISLLGKSVPNSLKIFLSALAIVDDLGAIIVIALFYTDQIDWLSLGICGGITVLLIILNKSGIKNLIFYLIPGLFLWYFMHHSGIHATIAGVILAFTIPTNISEIEISPLEKLEGKLHIPVSFAIMPLFALANTNITFQKEIFEGFINPLSMGIIGGLLIGKVLGINLFSWMAIKFKWAEFPAYSAWKEMIGVGFLAGIGFTMSIFVSLLAFPNEIEIQNVAKISILIASVLSGIVGYIILRSKKKPSNY
ncbi:Na+/H+ antiporter NhaA [Epilithonimonas ginsengisoli]|uniref:Na(+)/H(+) antiporter NhaA n=1 Tax=Epilithonimonas ginsengisoli TaxID=1245592 RepID=A0ABU4JM38_9FLAO|nr:MULTISPECIES: Na+/H+ antiporter NhaA [Chryseobacterium group]MBV6881731.1 Na+/H+ antiporter NhaA [Epilithonimonas sp. FP105]MDW8550767.1 Na+/H+ antiporter NhaA [Epilithonimonas ginsengisoli]OAH66320.1 sodium:proton antiporter [Chryseobacterium sp. FP211-J200]